MGTAFEMSDPETLRIALIGLARFGLGEPFAGGMEAHMATLARGLLRAGHEVVVFAGAATEEQPTDFDIRPVIERPPVMRTGDRLDNANPPGRAEAESVGYRRVMAAVLDGDFDIVHNASLHPVPVVATTDSPIPIVHALHTPPWPELESAHRSLTGGTGCRTVAAVSSSLARAWPGVVTDVVSNGIDTDRWVPSADRPEGGLLWIGRIVPEKGPDHAIAAARLLGRPLTLAGPIHDREYFANRIRRHLGSGVDYVGHLTTDELQTLCGRAAVGLVTPCWDEPFGLVAAEMQSCGLPVVGYRRGGLIDIVGPRTGLLVRANDPAALAGAIGTAETLARHEVRAATVKKFSTAAMVKGYVRIYRRHGEVHRRHRNAGLDRTSTLVLGR